MSQPSRVAAVRAALVLLVATPFPAAAQTPVTPALAAVRIPDDAPAIAVDGLLTEPAWREAPVSGDFRQREPLMGDPGSERTEIRVLYDAGTLYVGITAFDSDPSRIVNRILQRDRLLSASGFGVELNYGGDDVVVLLLDTFHDHRSGFLFATNPNGAEHEALLTDEGREYNQDWRGVWRVASQRIPEGWSAEFAIPFRTLRYPSGGDGVWGFNVARVIRRKNEETLWTGYSRNDGGLHRVSRAGHLEGLADLPRAGMNLEVKPFLLGGLTREEDDDENLVNGHRSEAGLDLKWEVRPGLVLDLTANTDFAQVEADDEQVNLTQFSLFFPEKREFFLENSGIFEYGFRSDFEPPPFLLFFSRRIGVSEDGEIPILGGARLTGRAGQQTVGLLNVVTTAAHDEPRTNNAVFRIKRDVGGSSYLGAMLTDRRSERGWNLAGGLDGQVWLSPSMNLQGFAAVTATDDGEGNDVAGRLRFDWQLDRFGIEAGTTYIGEDATADLGFITRTDMVRTDLQLRATPRPRALALRKLDIFLFGSHITDTHGKLLDWEIGPALGADWESGDQLTPFVVVGESTVDEAFDLADRVAVPEGRYDMKQFGLFGRTSPSRAVGFNIRLMLQNAFGGTVHNVTTETSFLPSPNLTVGLRHSRSWVDLPGGAFNSDLLGLRLTLAASTRLVANALVQYNSLENRTDANVRVQYTFRPGSDLFLVFNERRGVEGDLWARGERGALAKVTWLVQF